MGDPLHVRFHLRRLLVAPLGLLFQRAEDDFVQAQVDFDLARRRGELAQRQFPGKHFVKHHAERVDAGRRGI